MVCQVQTRSLPPLLRLSSVHSSDGPSLPLDLQLRRIPQPQVLLFASLLLVHHYPDDFMDHVVDSHAVSSQYDAISDAVLLTLWGDLGIFSCHSHHGLLQLPHLVDGEVHDDHRILRETESQDVCVRVPMRVISVILCGLHPGLSLVLRFFSVVYGHCCDSFLDLFL